MITYGLILIFVGLFLSVSSPLLLLPVAVLSVDYSTALSNISGYLSYLNVIMPVSELFILIGLALAVELTYFGYKGIRWVYRKIPGIT